jgi:hypothetical protein
MLTRDLLAVEAQRREASAARTALREQVGQLEQALAQASNEKANLVLALEAAETPAVEAPRVSQIDVL